MDFVVAIAVALVIHLVVLALFHKRYEPGLFRVVALAYAGTVLLRYSLATYLWLSHQDGHFSLALWGDSETYDGFGAALAESWSHGDSIHSWQATVEGKVNRGFIYFVAAVYYVFGRNVILVQFLNGIIGALTPIAILELGLVLYDRRVAVTAMLLTAFFPQMIFWSAALYKDPAVMLAIAANILSVFRLRLRMSAVWLVVYLATAAALVFLRFYIFYAIAAATLAGMLMRHRRGMALGFATQLGIVASVIVLLVYTPVGQEILGNSRFLDLQVLNVSRMDLARAGSGYAAEADVSTLSGILTVLPMGVAYLLFAPFPWSIVSLRQALALPDVLIWYALVPALVRGILAAHRRLRETMPILVFTTALTLAYGAFLGNAGTAYRQRTQVMMFYFLFAADGMRRRRKLAPESERGRDLSGALAEATGR
jgi:hypothetical protein